MGSGTNGRFSAIRTANRERNLWTSHLGVRPRAVGGQPRPASQPLGGQRPVATAATRDGRRANPACCSDRGLITACAQEDSLRRPRPVRRPMAALLVAGLNPDA